MKHFARNITAALLALVPVSCEIENDIPYPVVTADITAFEVSGMCDENGNEGGKAVIDKKNHTVNLMVDDTVNPASLLVTTFEVTNDAAIVPSSTACRYPLVFPTSSFSNLVDERTRTDFSSPVHFILRTYQDYDWTVSVTQVVIREVDIEGQVGKAVIDPDNRNVIVYVNDRQDLRALKVNEFSIGGQHGSVTPDPTSCATFDCSGLPVEFAVKANASNSVETWKLFVYKTDAKTPVTATAFARTMGARVSGTAPADATLSVEYRRQGESIWHTVGGEDITMAGTDYITYIENLAPSTAYEFRVSAGDESVDCACTTTAALQLENSSFDEWNSQAVGKNTLWNPWNADGESFWDTGNRGATTVGNSNSQPFDETSTGSGRSARLESKFIVIKFAAGNIFTGAYVKTDGTNGILDFGRPFCAFPTALSFDYKYKGALIDKIGNDRYDNLKGSPDECQIYIALTDWDAPMQIRTNPKNLSLFDKDDPNVIAYAEFISSAEQSTWKTETIRLDYRYDNRTPKYILVVCTSSRYGDFFTGGAGSTLWLDNLRLIYE